MTSQSRLRTSALSVTLWGFGFATTLLLIGAWGRTTSADEATLAGSATAVVGADVIRERIGDWVEANLPDGAVAAATPADVVDDVLSIPEVSAAMEGLIAEAVTAVVADPATAPDIDVGGALEPLSPLIAEELALEETSVRAALAGIEPIPLGDESPGRVSSTVRHVRGVLTLVVVLGALGMAATGAASVALSDDRRMMVRGLAIRVALSGFTFAMLFQLGGWLMDPNGGRSPVLTGSSILVRSNGHVFVLAAVAAVVIAVLVPLVVRRRRAEPVDEPADLVTV